VLVIFDTLRRDAVGCYGTRRRGARSRTPHLDAFARESVRFTRAYPEALPTLCARRTIYTGLRTYPFHNGDFPPHQGRLRRHRARLGTDSRIADDARRDVRGDGLSHRASCPTSITSSSRRRTSGAAFHQWTFIRGQEADAARSGPFPSQEEIDYWVPRELQELRGKATGPRAAGLRRALVLEPILLNMRDRVREEQWFNAQVMQESARWIEQNLDAKRPVPDGRIVRSARAVVRAEHYRRRYDAATGREQVISPYAGDAVASADLVSARAPTTRAGRDVRPLVRAPHRSAARHRRPRRGARHRRRRIHGHSLWSATATSASAAIRPDPKATSCRCWCVIRRRLGAGHDVRRLRAAPRHAADDPSMRRRRAGRGRSTASRSSHGVRGGRADPRPRHRRLGQAR
jgi:hypothetical protein